MAILIQSQSNWWQFIVLLILFILVLFGAYFSTKLFGKFQIKKGSSKNIHQLESISVGPQKFIQLIKIGEEFILIGVTKDKITFIKEIDKNNIDLNKYKKDNIQQVAPFSKHLEKFLGKK
ncbi:MAG: flagellar biosynthetic protein FliO [Vallitalea sp.]|jgi:flagellar protein FliO/FliZ|nr:flagellar biosynthetic protein FliO [Vallitalea sp.]